MTTTSKITVFVVGGSGHTGLFVVESLLQSGNFHVIILTRPQSAGKGKIHILKQKGVEVRVGDFAKASTAELEGLLSGVDIVLSLANIAVLEDQKKVFQAAKNVGVKRVVPSDFVIPCPPERELQVVNIKRDIRSFIKELGISYTFIDIGWWMEVFLPYPATEKGVIADLSHVFVDAGNVKTAVTSREDIGHFVARILADPRTLNAYVFCHAGEYTQMEAYRIGEEVSGQNFDSVKIHLSAKDIADRIPYAKEQRKNNISQLKLDHNLIALQYFNSIFIHGDNTLETAKKLGALDALALYPDFKPKTLRDFADEFYKDIPILEYDYQVSEKSL